MHTCFSQRSSVVPLNAQSLSLLHPILSLSTSFSFYILAEYVLASSSHRVRLILTTFTTMKRSYDYSFAHEDREHTFAISQHSFEHIHPHTIATQAAPYLIGSSAQAVQPPSDFAYRAVSGQHPYLGLRSPLLSGSSCIDDDFQSNAAAQKAEANPQASPSDFWAKYRANSGTTGLGILYGGLAQEQGQTLTGDTTGTVIKTEPPSDGLDSWGSPVPGGFLDLLSRPYSGSPGSLHLGSSCVEPASTSLLTRGITTTGDPDAFYLGSSTPSLLSIPSLLYPSSSDLAQDTQPLFYSGDSESSVEGTLVNASFSGLYSTSSTEASASDSPVKKPLFYASSSSGSVDDNSGSYSAKDAFSTLLNLDSPLLGLGSDGIPVKQREPVVGLYADVNLRTLPTRHDSPQVYVNPADVMGQQDMGAKTEEEQEVVDLLIGYDSQPHILAPAQDSTDCEAGTGFTEEAVQAIVNVISAAQREDVDKTTLPEPPQVIEAIQPVFSLPDVPPPVIPQPTHFPFAPPREVVPGPVNTHPSLRVSHAPAPPPIAPAPTSVPPQACAANLPRGLSSSLDHAPYMFFPSSLTALHPRQRTPLVDRQPPAYPGEVQAHASHMPPADDRQTPICNAHMGVELDELRRRADAFRVRNPDADIDKTWLQAFAGRLSEGGALIDEWRCYVKGCAQRNKRRDHILVHVGSHVEHRPFACEQWCVFTFSSLASEADRRRIQWDALPAEERVQAPRGEPRRGEAVRVPGLCADAAQELRAPGPAEAAHARDARRGGRVFAEEDEAGRGR